MAEHIRLTKELLTDAQKAAQENKRTLQEQIEHWIAIGKIAEDNPDLPGSMIKGILIGLREMEEGKLELYEGVGD